MTKKYKITQISTKIDLFDFQYIKYKKLFLKYPYIMKVNIMKFQYSYIAYVVD